MIIAPNARTKCRACARVAAYTVNVIVMLEEGPDGQRQVGRLKSEIQICDDHQKTMRVDDVLDSAGWRRLAAVFTQNGKPSPDRTRCRLEFVPVSKPRVIPADFGMPS